MLVRVFNMLPSLAPWLVVLLHFTTTHICSLAKLLMFYTSSLWVFSLKFIDLKMCSPSPKEAIHTSSCSFWLLFVQMLLLWQL